MKNILSLWIFFFTFLNLNFSSPIISSIILHLPKTFNLGKDVHLTTSKRESETLINMPSKTEKEDSIKIVNSFNKIAVRFYYKEIYKIIISINPKAENEMGPATQRIEKYLK